MGNLFGISYGMTSKHKIHSRKYCSRMPVGIAEHWKPVTMVLVVVFYKVISLSKTQMLLLRMITAILIGQNFWLLWCTLWTLRRWNIQDPYGDVKGKHLILLKHAKFLLPISFSCSSGENKEAVLHWEVFSKLIRNRLVGSAWCDRGFESSRITSFIR